MDEKIVNKNGSKDGLTWEEKVRDEGGSDFNRFSDIQYLKNLKLLSKWCEKKINEISEKIK